MKFIRYEFQNRYYIGILDRTERYIADLNPLFSDKCLPDMQAVIAKLTDADIAFLQKELLTFEDKLRSGQQYDLAEADGFRWISAGQVHTKAPIEFPVHDILCVGVNYMDHLKEANEKLYSFEKPSNTVFFSKRANRLLGSGEKLFYDFSLDEELDYEVELAIIIGKEGKNIPKEKAEEYIFGYSVFNDISARNIQRSHGQWFLGKSLDDFCIMGPAIIHKSALPFPIEVSVRSFLNGECRQSSNTRHFLTDPATIISELSQGMTLFPGDIISTGTPSGVGMGMNPPSFMKAGDTIVCEIEAIGRLENQIIQNE